MGLHAKHIFDMDDLRPAQYFYAYRNATSEYQLNLGMATFFPNFSADAATSAMLNVIVANEGTIGSQSVQEMNFNDAVTSTDDGVESNLFMGSRLFPEAVYRDSPNATYWPNVYEAVRGWLYRVSHTFFVYPMLIRRVAQRSWSSCRWRQSHRKLCVY